jgi:hypothetical protein
MPRKPPTKKRGTASGRASGNSVSRQLGYNIVRLPGVWGALGMTVAKRRLPTVTGTASGSIGAGRTSVPKRRRTGR